MAIRSKLELAATDRSPLMARVRVRFDSHELKMNVRQYKEDVDKAIEFLVNFHATEAARNMKMNAPWTDRTSAARNGLFTAVTKRGEGHYTIILSHSVHYGIWLEVKFSGRDAIVAPTVISQGQALMKDLKEMVR